MLYSKLIKIISRAWVKLWSIYPDAYLPFIAQYKSGSVSLVTAYSLLYTFLSCSKVLNFSVRQNGFDQVI